MKLRVLFHIVITMSLCCIASITIAQNTPYIQWQKSFGGDSHDFAYSIQPTFDGGYIVTGGSLYGDSLAFLGDEDYLVIKLDNAGNIEWEKVYGGSNWDEARSIQQTSDNGYIVAGYSKSYDEEVTGHHFYGFDYWIVKLDSIGNILWEKSLGGSGWDYAFSIQQTNDGGYIVAGQTYSTDGDVTGNHGQWDCWIVKLTSGGSIEWEKTYGGSGDDGASSVQQTRDGGYIIAGSSNSTDGDVTGNHGNNDYWIVKIDALGNIQWQKSLGGSNDDGANCIQQTIDGGYIVAGGSTSSDGDVSGPHMDTSHATSDYWIVKLSSNGEIEWEKALGGSGNDVAYCVQQINDGGYIVAGMSNSPDGDVTGDRIRNGYLNTYDFWIVKLTITGNLEWERTYGGTGDETAYSIKQTGDNGYIIAGMSTSSDGDVTFNHGEEDYWVVKLSEVCSSEGMNFDMVDIGNCKIDTFCFSNTGDAPDTLTHIYFIGANASRYSLRKATFKILKPGESEAIVFGFCPTEADTQNAIAAFIIGTGDTVFIPVYGAGVQPASIKELGLVQSGVLLPQNYPNPFTGATQIQYTTPQAGDVSVTVMDAVGNKVAELFNGWQAAGSHTVSFDAKDLPAGVYFVRFVCNGAVMTKPVIVVR